MDAYDLIARRDDIIEQDYFTADFSNKYDVILTNPPYLKDTIKTTEGLSEYILKALKEVKVGGTVIMFLKTLHLESKVRYEKIYKHYPPSKLYVYASRISCYKNGDFYSKPEDEELRDKFPKTLPRQIKVLDFKNDDFHLSCIIDTEIQTYRLAYIKGECF